MNFGQAIRSVFSQYATFSGRAQRSEYWYWVVFQWLVLAALMLVGGFGFSSGVGDMPVMGMGTMALFFIATVLPTLAVSVRRLHDMDRSGWWLLAGLIPYIGGLVLFIWFMFAGTSGDNQFGPDPLGGFDDADSPPVTHQSSIPSIKR